MSHPDDDAVAKALSDLPPGTLEQAAQLLPPSLRGLLRTLADAPGDDDPAARVAAVRAQLADVDETAVRDVLGQLTRALGDEGARIASALEAAEGQAERASVQRDLLVELSEDQPEVAPRLQPLIDALGDLPETLTRIVGGTRGLAEDVVALAATATAGDAGRAEALAARLDDLDRAADDAEGAAARLKGLLPILDTLTEDLSGHPAAPRLQASAAAVVEELDSRAAAVPRWQQLLDAAAESRDVALAQLAGQRLQLEALNRGDLTRAAEVAGTVAQTAIGAGARRPAVLATLEQAALYSRLGETARGVSMARGAVEASRDAEDASLLARARLTLGQMLAADGDAAAARRAFRAVMQAATEDRSFPAEVARAALDLGRLQRDTQPAQARKNLTLALELGLRLQDPRLVVPATEALCHAATDEEATALLARVRSALPAPLFRGLIDALADDLGRRRVRAWVDAAEP